jgi:hypothetical protein
MLINESTDRHCEACGDEVDVLHAGFENVTPLLCPDCKLQLFFDEEREEVAAAA